MDWNNPTEYMPRRFQRRNKNKAKRKDNEEKAKETRNLKSYPENLHEETDRKARQDKILMDLWNVC